MAVRSRTTHVVVHTPADARKDRAGNHLDTDGPTITRWHTAPAPAGRGWSHVGYHWLVRKSGAVNQLLREHLVGIHCRDGGYNSKSVGVCFSGHGGDDYNKIPGEPWTEAQQEAGIRLIADICERFGIPARNVIGHREAPAAKACPGDRISMDRVRRLVAEELARRKGSPSNDPAEPPARPVIRRGATGPHVEALQRALRAAGDYRGAVDGDFGPATETAVKAYQARRRLGADGIVGPATWTAIDRDGL